MARDEKSTRKARRVTFILGGVILAVAAIFIVTLAVDKFEASPPRFELTPPVESIGVTHTLQGLALDEGSGLKKLWIAILQGQNEVVLLDKTFESNGWLGEGTVHKYDVSLPIDIKDHKLSHGAAILRVNLSDYSYRRWWEGNRTYEELPIVIDTVPPEITVLSRQHNLNQGGSGLVVYALSEPVSSTGIWVGDRFFDGQTGYFSQPDRYIAFFALPHTMGPQTQLYVSATDHAGNTSKRGISYYINEKVFPKDTLYISDRFLRQKMPEFDSLSLPGPPADSPLDKFLVVNRDLRAANYKTVQKVCEKSDPKKYWTGSFTRLPRSARKAGFADRRSYVYNGKTVDNQLHLGVDLASTARSPVPASNTGRVCFADSLGIYGKTVIIDHGFSLFSMYGHLSRVNVVPDQMVTKGDIIGLTGTTGMAGGDHLHFSMLVHHTFVNPIEWWDENWINHNITDKLTRLTQ